jgi:signal transduction histidine kinase
MTTAPASVLRDATPSPVTTPGSTVWTSRVVAVAVALAGLVMAASLGPAARQTAVATERHERQLGQLGLSPWTYSLYVTGLVAVLALVCLGAAFLLAQLPDPQRTAATSSALVLAALGVVMPQTVPALAAGHPGGTLLMDVLESLTVVALTAWLLTFPGRSAPSRAVRAAVVVVVAVEASQLLGLLDAEGATPAVLTGVWVVGLVATTVVRYLRGDTDQRARSRWVLYAVCAALTTMLLAGVAQGPLDAGPGTVLDLAVQAAVVVSFLLIPVSIVAALLRRRLWGLPGASGRALTYALLLVPVTAAYLCAVAGATALFPGHATGAAAIVAALLALAVHPAYLAARRLVDAALFGRPDVAGSRLASLAFQGMPAEGSDVLAVAAGIVVQSLRLPYAQVEVCDSDGTVVAAGSAGEAGWDGPTSELPLHHAGRRVGRLVVAMRDQDGSAHPGDEDALRTLRPPVAVLTGSLLIQHELQESRRELINAREQERRRLRDDLHDELGPALGAITLKLAAAGNRLPGDPATARQLLVEASAQTTTAVADVRRLVHGLRPPSLDDLGLVGALRAFASNLGPARPVVTVTAPRWVPPLPAAVEAATYRLVLEAVTNAVRHSGADRCQVSIDTDDRQLTVEVRDDGCGIAIKAGPRGGHGLGLTSMRARVTELDGTFEVHGRPGAGTVVRAALPLPEQAAGPRDGTDVHR